MDDKTFQSALLETQVKTEHYIILHIPYLNTPKVMMTKDHTKWNFEVLHDLIEGPLLNPKRMEEAIKVSRFIRRLLSFFHPFSHRFSDTPQTHVSMYGTPRRSRILTLLQANQRWVKLGCSLMSTLMASTDGIRFLSTEDLLLKQLTKSFAQLDPVSLTIFIVTGLGLNSCFSSTAQLPRIQYFLKRDLLRLWPTVTLKC